MNPLDPELTVSPSCLARFHCIKKFCCFSALFQYFIKNSCSFFSFSFISHTINLPPIIMLLYFISSFKNAPGIRLASHSFCGAFWKYYCCFTPSRYYNCIIISRAVSSETGVAYTFSPKHTISPIPFCTTKRSFPSRTFLSV